MITTAIFSRQNNSHITKQINNYYSFSRKQNYNPTIFNRQYNFHNTNRGWITIIALVESKITNLAIFSRQQTIQEYLPIDSNPAI